MTELDLTMIEALEERGEGEFDDMGSHNHSMVQANLAYLFKQLGSYSVYIELSLDVRAYDLAYLDIKDELIPNVCIYPKRPLSIPHDILRMTEMPLLAVEVLSLRQGTYSILQKFEAYFSLGVQSCWLVEPGARVVHVYSSPAERVTFASGNVIDERLNIEILISEIFE
ncbi:MAG: Uma2 family endonuclease [Caldilineaceae bacterium]